MLNDVPYVRVPDVLKFWSSFIAASVIITDLLAKSTLIFSVTSTVDVM